jgi:3-dehydroquinate synthase
MEKVHVELGARSYDVLIDFDFLSDLGAELRSRALARDNVAVVTSPTIGGYYFNAVESGLRESRVRNIGRFDLPDGEESKSLENFVQAMRWLAQFTPDPSVEPTLLALGGGVVGDLGGFAAACFRRGIPYGQVPTTLLAAVDSSVGGKTAVNLPEGKNLVGAVYQPRLVYVDLATFRTLPQREVRSGIAEVIKYGAALDGDLFQFLEHSIEELVAVDPAALLRVVPACVQLKADVVQQDEQDRGHVRICLNFGHTLGHAIERAAEPRLTHGECVAIGMVAAARISVACGIAAPDLPGRLEEVILRAGLPVRAGGLDLESVLSLMEHDKKFVTGQNRFVLLTDIGQWAEREAVPAPVVREAARSVLL